MMEPAWVWQTSMRVTRLLGAGVMWGVSIHALMDPHMHLVQRILQLHRSVSQPPSCHRHGKAAVDVIRKLQPRSPTHLKAYCAVACCTWHSA